MRKRVDSSTDIDGQSVTVEAATKLGGFFRSLIARGESRRNSQRLTLQCAILFFLEDTGFLGHGSFRGFLNDNIHGDRLSRLPASLSDQIAKTQLLGAILHPWAPIELEPPQFSLLVDAGNIDWSQIHPGIFGTIFQSTMGACERHERGAYYTPNHAIREYVIRPALIEPWRARIADATTPNELFDVCEALTNLRILDPACGSGNFLYEAFLGLEQLVQEVFAVATNRFSEQTRRTCENIRAARRNQLLGIDRDPLAVELARVTILLGQKRNQHAYVLADFVCADALFCAWPQADLIIGNPPFQSKNRMQREFGPDYVQRLRKQSPDVPGRADYCVYWFRRTHDALAPGARAGLVGTNTIRQNYSREGGLDYVVKKGGIITEAVSSMVWPGDAIVHVSVVNWIKGDANGAKKLSWQVGDQLDSPWHETRVATIPSSLSAEVDVTEAKTLLANANSAACFQGQTHGHEGFLLSPEEARAMFASSKKNRNVIFPYLIGDDLLSHLHGKPSRWVIDFFPREQREARPFTLPFQRIKDLVLPDRETAAQEETRRNEKIAGKGNHHHANFLKRWWQLGYPRGELMAKLETLHRYIVCSRVTKRPVFEFVSSGIHPSDALTVFPLDDDYSFGILQSSLHWAWFTARCSTLTARFRYTSETVFNSFPWPRAPTEKQCLAIAKAAVALRALRRRIANEYGMNLRSMYASMEDAGKHELKEAHAALDKAVRAAYGMPGRKDPLAFLLELNQECAEREADGQTVTGPGLPAYLVRDVFVTNDCIEMEEA